MKLIWTKNVVLRVDRLYRPDALSLLLRVGSRCFEFEASARKVPEIGYDDPEEIEE